MAGPDILLFVVGALLLGGATFAIVAQGGPSALGGGSSPTSIFSVSWSVASVNVSAPKAIPDLGSSTRIDVPVTATNVTQLTFAIQCTDAVPAGAPVGPFEVTMSVAPPNGIPAPKAVTAPCGGSLKVDVPVASVPPPTNVQGATADAAAATLPSDPNATMAVGTWSVTVSGSRAGGTPLPGLPAGDPGGTLAANAQTWQPQLTPVTK